ncbi:MAG: bifunctional tetrahydrofolate synthase/dihydrofolate synthase [Gammaproteobacteria bacterium]|nr:bifunctional tetrahydrofolate synthase/dihydrofolate synthase [Gammaproteobacteria bacterium]
MNTSILSPPQAISGARFDSLDDWLDWQERLHFTAIELGLDRCREVAQRMGLLRPEFTVVSIAGTNGKGSSAAMLDLILRQAGYRVGRYTSPHLLRYNERICIGGAEIDDDALCRAFERVDRARGEVSLTYFEFGTLAALEIFRSAGIDLAVLEVGLGGRLDAVNMIDPDVALVTTVDLDHERWLGFDRDSIGREKAGIYRAGRPAICADPDPPRSVAESAGAVGAQHYQLHRDFTFESHAETWDWRSGESVMADLPRPSANHRLQVQNAAGILMVLRHLPPLFQVNCDAICAGLVEFRLPGRFQIVPGVVPHIFDVAHNRQAAEVLALNLAALPCKGETHMVIGMLKDKNHQAVLSALAGSADTWHLVSLDGERGAGSRQLAEALAHVGHRGTARAFETVPDAMKAVGSLAAPGDRIVVTGSFVTVGAAMRSLGISA